MSVLRWNEKLKERVSHQDIQDWISETLTRCVETSDTAHLLEDCQQLLGMISIVKGKTPRDPMEMLTLAAEYYANFEIRPGTPVEVLARRLGDYRTQGRAGEEWARVFLRLDHWGVLGQDLDGGSS